MTISKYEAFNAVVELGSLTKAAEALKLTQSGGQSCYFQFRNRIRFFSAYARSGWDRFDE